MSNSYNPEAGKEYKCVCCSIVVKGYDQEDPDQIASLCRECTRDRKMFAAVALFVTDPREPPVRAAQAVKIADELLKAFWAIPFGGSK